MAAWAGKALQLHDWLIDTTGLTLARYTDAEHPTFDGAAAVHAETVACGGVPIDRSEGRGAALFAALRRSVVTSGVEVWYGVTPRTLAIDHGAVVGIQVADRSGRLRRVRCRCGGNDQS